MLPLASAQPRAEGEAGELGGEEMQPVSSHHRWR